MSIAGAITKLEAESGPRRITPQRRRQLQEQWERGRQLLAQRRRQQRRQGLELLAGCVALDPGNRFYVELLLQQAAREKTPWWRRLSRWSSRRRLLAAAGNLRWTVVLEKGPPLLIDFPHCGRLPFALADACRAFGLRDAERAYCQFARDQHPSRLEPARRLAEALMRAADYPSATIAWRRVLQLNAQDEQGVLACRLLQDAADPDGAAQAEAQLQRLESEPHRAETLAGPLQEWIDRGWLQLAERGLAIARTAAPGELRLMHVAENLLLAQAQRQVEIAAEWLRAYPEQNDAEVLEDASANLQRVQLDVATSRSQREPGSPAAAFELAQSLQQARRWPQAAELYQSLVSVPPFVQRAHLGLGECLQQMRRFSQALDQYRAVSQAPEGEDPAAEGPPGELRRLAMYREAVLAEAMGQFQDARARLEELSRLAPEYRDVRTRLDKLLAMRHKG